MSSERDESRKFTAVEVGAVTYNVSEKDPREFNDDDKNLVKKFFSKLKDCEIFAIILQEVTMGAMALFKDWLTRQPEISKETCADMMESCDEKFREWTNFFKDVLCCDENNNDKFDLVACPFGSLLMVVGVDRSLPGTFDCLKFKCMPFGIGNRLGNKGAIGCQLRIRGHLLAIVGCHLTAHEQNVGSRVEEVIRITEMAIDGTTSIEQHDSAIIMGDMNFRVEADDPQWEYYLHGKMWEHYALGDQLNKHKECMFHDFTEKQINYAPTFKFVHDSDQYDLLRNPSFTDRIMHQSLRMEMFGRAQAKFSDHRGICGIYTMYTKPIQIKNWGIGHNYTKVKLHSKLVNLHRLDNENCLNFGKVPFYKTVTNTFHISNENYAQVIYDIKYDNNIAAMASSEAIIDPMFAKELTVALRLKNVKWISDSSQPQQFESTITLEPRHNSDEKLKTLKIKIKFEFETPKVFGQPFPGREVSLISSPETSNFLDTARENFNRFCEHHYNTAPWNQNNFRHKYIESQVEHVVQCIEKGEKFDGYGLCDVLYTVWLLLIAYPGRVCLMQYDDGMMQTTELFEWTEQPVTSSALIGASEPFNEMYVDEPCPNIQAFFTQWIKMVRQVYKTCPEAQEDLFVLVHIVLKLKALNRNSVGSYSTQELQYEDLNQMVYSLLLEGNLEHQFDN